jgi:DNA invertase Pin-like site-specific DNA recombinase
MMTDRKPNTMLGYVRVSRRMGREGPGYISKDVQRDAVQRWADYRGVRIVDWLVDEDESGGTEDRPGLREAMRRVESGDVDGIACWRLNRFARNVAGAIEDVKRIQAAGGVLAFVEEDIDPTGPFGEFLLTVLLAVATLERDNLVSGWKTAKARAIERGAHIGPTPYGYRRLEDGTLAVDEAAAPVVSEAFAVAARDGVAAATAFLTANVPERTWTNWTTRRFLSTRTYLGEVRNGDHVRTDAHDGVVTRAIFEAVKRILDSAVRPRRAKADFPLSGIAVCEACGGQLVGGRGGADNRRMYRCAARCDRATVLSADPFEAHVVSMLRNAFQHPGFRIGGENADTSALEAALLEAENELDAFASDLGARKLLGHRYHHHLEQRVEAVDQAREALHEALAEVEDAQIVIPDEMWDDLEPRELAEVLRAGLNSVIVSKGRGPLSGRVRVVPKGMDGAAVPGAQDPQERVLEA